MPPSALHHPSLLAAYNALVDDFVGYREALERDDLQRWLANLDGFRVLMDQVLERGGKPVPNALIAPWPVSNLGARTHATADGDLVLVNTGSAVVADAMARICTILFDGYPDDAAGRAVGVARSIIRDELTPNTANDIPFRSERAGGIRLLSGFAAVSPICHEYGHIALGHTGHGVDRALLDIRRAWPTEGAVLWSQRQELETDQLGLDLALNAAPASDSDVVRVGGQRYAVLGALLMLSLQGLVLEFYWGRGQFEVGDGHPPPIVRAAGLMMAAEVKGLEDAVGAGQAYLNWFERHAVPAMRNAIQEGVVG